MKVYLAVVSASALLACSSKPPEPSAVVSSTSQNEVVLEVGQRAVLTGDIGVRFVSVLQDSRCPQGVTCVWAGDAAVLLEVGRADSSSSSDTLHTNGQGGAQALVHRHVRIELAAVDPYPGEPGPRQGPYRVRLRWSFLPD